MPSANVAYSFGPRAWLDDLTCYNNLSMTRLVGHSSGGGATPGRTSPAAACRRGGMLTHVDWIAGRNMWFAGGDGIGINNGGPSRWHSRLNLNIGVYF